MIAIETSLQTVFSQIVVTNIPDSKFSFCIKLDLINVDANVRERMPIAIINAVSPDSPSAEAVKLIFCKNAVSKKIYRLGAVKRGSYYQCWKY